MQLKAPPGQAIAVAIATMTIATVVAALVSQRVRYRLAKEEFDAERGPVMLLTSRSRRIQPPRNSTRGTRWQTSDGVELKSICKIDPQIGRAHV